MFFLYHWYLLLIYQPLFNIIFIAYSLLNKAFRDGTDMGIVLIVLTLLFRVFWLPVSLASGRSYKEKRKIEEQLEKVKEELINNPEKRKKEVHKITQISKTTAFFSSLNFIVHILITLVLIRFFRQGITQDTNLLYSFNLNHPEINLLFSNTYILIERSWTLSLFLALAVFIYEVISSQFSYNKSKQDVKIQIGLPIIVFIVSLFIPSGVILFLVTTLSFSIFFTLIKHLYFWNLSLGEKINTQTSDKTPKEEKKPAIAAK